MNQHIDSAIEAVLATRDFCGDERQAIKDIEGDFVIRFTEIEKRCISRAVELQWKESQSAAGVVHPLTSGERAKAFAAVENVENRP